MPIAAFAGSAEAFNNRSGTERVGWQKTTGTLQQQQRGVFEDAREIILTSIDFLSGQTTIGCLVDARNETVKSGVK